MFDLIGYWGAITFLISMVLVWVLPLCVSLVDYLINLVTDGDFKSFIKDKYGNLNAWSYFIIADNPLLWALLLVGVLAVNMFIIGFTPIKGSLLGATKFLATTLTPVFSYLIIIVLSTTLSLYLSRFIYSLFKDIKTLKEKVKDHE